jgi:hypothetical protein
MEEVEDRRTGVMRTAQDATNGLFAIKGERNVGIGRVLRLSETIAQAVVVPVRGKSVDPQQVTYDVTPSVTPLAQDTQTIQRPIRRHVHSIPKGHRTGQLMRRSTTADPQITLRCILSGSYRTVQEQQYRIPKRR